MGVGATMTRERWKKHPTHDVEVSSLGRVRGKRGLKKTFPDRAGYTLVAIHPRNGDINKPIHRLVLETFIGPRPRGKECRHRNSIKSDNRLRNLCWGTPKQNTADRRKEGTLPVGKRVWSYRWSPLDYTRAARLHLKGHSIRAIAGVTGISRTQLRRRLLGYVE